MKKIFTIDENEKSRILEMHKIAIKNEYLNEQATQATITAFETPEAKKVYDLFNTEFLPSLIQGYFNMKPDEAIGAIRNLTDEQLSGAIGFFTSKGYKQPNNPNIIKYQQELMNKTDISTFTTIEGKTSKFDDGTFGVATAKATLKTKIDRLLKLPKNKTLGEIDVSHKERPKSGQVVPAAKIKTGPNIKIKTGTQPIE